MIANTFGKLSVYGKCLLEFLHSILNVHESLNDYPRTVYLQRWMLTSIMRQYYVPKRLVVRSDRTGVPCEICDGIREAVAAVLGGVDVQCVRENKIRLSGMPHLVTSCCAACFHAATGTELAHVYQQKDRDPHFWTVMPLSFKRPYGS